MRVGVVTFHLCIGPAVCDEHEEEDTAVHLTAPWYQELALYSICVDATIPTLLLH